MTITETRPATTPAEAEGLPKPTWLGALFGTGDHKAIGRLFIITSLVFLLATSVVGELLAANRLDGPGKDTFLHGNVFFQTFTIHSVGSVFLVLIPLILGVALLVVPLQVGARTVAFARTAALSYWVFLVAGGLLIASYLVDGGPGGISEHGTDLWAVSFIGVLLGLLAATVCVITTVIALRTTGMTLDRVPLFSWSMVTAGVIWLLTLPVLIAVLLLVFVDHHYGQLLFGANQPIPIYSRVVWAFQQPEVYALAAPALGFAADVFAVTARARHSAHKLAMVAIGLFSVLGFGAFVVNLNVPSQVSGTDPKHTALYAIVSFAVVIPVLLLAGLWADTFRRGRRSGTPTRTSAALFALGAFLLIGAGAWAGLFESIQPLKLQDTLFDSAQAHFVLLGGVVAMVGALHWWDTKIFGRSLRQLLGSGAAALLVVGAAAMAIADLFSGAIGDAAAGETAKVHGGVQSLNYVMAIGGILFLVGVLVVFANVVLAALAKGRETPSDPWAGHTLEWLSDSPPAYENFTDLPLVTSEAPLLDRREAQTTEATA